MYETLSIGTQTWMVSDLKTTKYNDGTVIPQIEDITAWVNSTTPAYCWYDNDESANKCTYGALYNWYAVDKGSNGGKNICPTGWHVPSDEEWKTLEMHLGMTQEQADAENWRSRLIGGKLKETGDAHWVFPNTAATNSSGFTAIPGGYRNNTFAKFYNKGATARWWTSTANGDNAWDRYLFSGTGSILRRAYDKGHGFSVRCLRD